MHSLSLDDVGLLAIISLARGVRTLALSTAAVLFFSDACYFLTGTPVPCVRWFSLRVLAHLYAFVLPWFAIRLRTLVWVFVVEKRAGYRPAEDISKYFRIESKVLLMYRTDGASCGNPYHLLHVLSYLSPKTQGLLFRSVNIT